ncbi:MAG: ComF family protein [Candidatus Bruticola sp.]
MEGRIIEVKERPWWELALDFLYVPDCPGCGRLAIYGLCADCLKGVQPLKLKLPTGLIVYCGGWYERSLKKAVLSFKKMEQTYLLFALVRLMLRALPANWTKFPLYCLSVPANRRRRRSFYGPDLMAQELLRQVPQWQSGQNWLRPVRRFQVQKMLRRRERFHNVQGGYEASAEVEGKHIVIIDDVTTTGATLEEAALALQQRGAAGVAAFTAAASSYIQRSDIEWERLEPNKLKIV